MLSNCAIHSQNVYEPLNSTVYNFLERLSVKDLIQVHSEIKPYSRMKIAEYLSALETQKNVLSKLELQDLEFYRNDYSDEINFLKGVVDTNKVKMEFMAFGENNRFRDFYYKDTLITVNADIILGYSTGKIKDSRTSHFWNGAILYGYISDFIGYSLNFKDNQENGKYLDQQLSFSPLSGIDHTSSINSGHDSFQHDEVNATLTVNWKWGSFSFGKDFINWGSSLTPAGQIIISSKAPSFPFIQLEMHPAKWLRFSYIHGWLHSGILDSNTYHYSPVPGRENYLQINKFIAAHLLSVDVKKNITISIGESIIYSERIEPVYLIPIMFFRVADHYLSKDTSNTGSNAQVFIDASYKIPDIRCKFYMTIFIDELSLTSVLENKAGPSAVGYSFGGEVIDPIFENSALIFEYTKIPPFVYMNSNTAQTYASYGYQLGSWIGNNGDIKYIKYTQNIIRGLSLNVWANFIRKGSAPTPQQQYKAPYPSTLFGLRKNQTEIGIEASYEIINNCWIKFNYAHSEISDQDIARTPYYLLGQNNSLNFSVSYGFNTASR